MNRIMQTFTQRLAVGAVMAALVPIAAFAAGQGSEGEGRESVVYEGERYSLVRKLSGDEIIELVSGHTLVFIHPHGEEQEFHSANGQTINGFGEQGEANGGFWQVEGDEICWTYASGTHCKPIWASERDGLYGQVPGWYDGPLPFVWEPGDSRQMQERPMAGDAI